MEFKYVDSGIQFDNKQQQPETIHSVQTENNKKKDLKCFYLFQLIFWLIISSNHSQSKINEVYLQVKL